MACCEWKCRQALSVWRRNCNRGIQLPLPWYAGYPTFSFTYMFVKILSEVLEKYSKKRRNPDFRDGEELRILALCSAANKALNALNCLSFSKKYSYLWRRRKILIFPYVLRERFGKAASWKFWSGKDYWSLKLNSKAPPRNSKLWIKRTFSFQYKLARNIILFLSSNNFSQNLAKPEFPEMTFQNCILFL